MSVELVLPQGREIQSTRDLMRCVFSNIKNLVRNNPATLTDLAAWDALQNQTHALIEQMERMPLRSLRASIRRRRRRCLKKKRQLRAKELIDTVEVTSKVQESLAQGANAQLDPELQLASRRTWKTGERFLVILEQLELLIFARIRDHRSAMEISRKLLVLKKIWADVMQEYKETERSNQPAVEKWYELLFGESFQSLNPEQAIPRLKQFIWKRGIWDSYIDDQQGSTMPSGWVLPNQEQNSWSHMLQHPNEPDSINQQT